MSEIGLDLSQEFPKPLTDEVVEAADLVVTMGCGDACPIYPGKKYEDWQIADPAGAPVDEVRAIRGEIRAPSSRTRYSDQRDRPLQLETGLDSTTVDCSPPDPKSDGRSN